ncbi:cysteine--tRNA ligase [Candidatus Saccharibacteria bacterium]|nr:cysteine--tRNA ligase [Candidatus Saccharibacteria bacterium]
MLKLYNSLTKKKEEFKPIHAGHANIYSCGPTVYDHVHIGNLRAFLLPDLLQRVLRYVEHLDVTWVMNITDVDDKIIARAARDNKSDEPITALGKLADRYTDVFINDIEKVGIDRADISRLPRATDNIAEIQELIRHLVAKQIAYISDGSVYFSLEHYKKAGHKYGVLANVQFNAQARVIDDQDQKEGVGDFALWKAQKSDEPAWDFEIEGQNLRGRPGWHIECSVMSTKYLGQPFDIHTGGVDLKFPHHENEIAQCGGDQAHYYLHNEFVNVENSKMAKSVGNFLTIEDVKDPIAFRYLCLQAHYRSEMNYSSEVLAAAGERLKNLRKYADQLTLVKEDQLAEDDKSGKVAEFMEKFNQSLQDDLNSPEALAALSLLEGKAYNQQAKKAMQWADSVLGLRLVNDEPIAKPAQELISNYERARERKDYEASDKLREELEKEFGLGVSDTEIGTLIHRL